MGCKVDSPSLGPTQTGYMPFERAHRDEQTRVVGFSMCLVVVEETDGESLRGLESYPRLTWRVTLSFFPTYKIGDGTLKGHPTNMHLVPFDRARRDEQNPIVRFSMHLVVVEKNTDESPHRQPTILGAHQRRVTLDLGESYPRL